MLIDLRGKQHPSTLTANARLLIPTMVIRPLALAAAAAAAKLQRVPGRDIALELLVCRRMTAQIIWSALVGSVRILERRRRGHIRLCSMVLDSMTIHLRTLENK